MKDKISFVIPTLNEINTIYITFFKLDKICQELKIDYEFVCIDGNSQDGTLEEIKRCSDYFDIKFETQKNLKGPSHAIMQGINISNGNYIAIIDADNPVTEKCLKLLIIGRKKKNLVIGSRFLKNSKIRNVSKIKLIFSRIFTLLISVVIKKKITDSSHYLRIFPKEINFNAENLIHPIFFWENTIYCVKKGLEVSEISINYSERTSGISKLSNLKLMKNTILSLFYLVTILFTK